MSCTFINWVYICVRKSFVFINLGLGYKIYLFKAVRPICIHVRSPPQARECRAEAKSGGFSCSADRYPLKRENVGQRPKAVASRAPLTGSPPCRTASNFINLNNFLGG